MKRPAPRPRAKSAPLEVDRLPRAQKPDLELVLALGVHEQDRALPDHLGVTPVRHEQRRVLLDSDSALLGVLQHQSEEPVLALPLHEVLVDDHSRHEPQALAHHHAVAVDHGEVAVAGDHAQRHHGGARARAAEDDAVRVTLADGREQLRVGAARP